VLRGAEALTAPELDQRVTELVGVQPHAVRVGQALRVGRWFNELVDVALRGARGTDGTFR
jgi:hypothetical protein